LEHARTVLLTSNKDNGLLKLNKDAQIGQTRDLFQIILLAAHQDGTKQVRWCSHSTTSWTTSGTLSRGFIQSDLPRQSFVGHSGHMTEPT